MTKNSFFRPSILNIYKPANLSSFDVVYKIKKLIPKSLNCKIGHFGTLDPFAEGVMLLGFFGATKLNGYIHDNLTKTYLAGGILGLETETGDLTIEPHHRDESDFFHTVISKFDKKFIQEQLQKKFLGDYLQAPHVYSASKFEGKKLHQWAREGVKIHKEKVCRQVHSLEVKEVNFPRLAIEYEVSSGTFIRTLFSDSANFLGTLGVLEKLKRTAIGNELVANSFSLDSFSDENDIFSRAKNVSEVLIFPEIIFSEFDSKLVFNGQTIERENLDFSNGLYWSTSFEKTVLGLARVENKKFKILTQFSV